MKLVLIIVLMSIVSACSSTSAIVTASNPRIEIFDNSALAIIDPAVSIDILADGFSWTEGPVWVAEGEYLLFSDIPNNRIYKYSDDEGLSTYLDPSGATGLYSDDYMAASLSAPESKFKTMASEYKGQRLNSPNDGVFDALGNLYFTDPPYGLEKANQDPRKQLLFNGIFLFNTSGELILLDDQVSYPNGIILSKDEQTLIVAVSDHEKPHWLAYDVSAGGTLQNKRLWYDASHLLNQEGEQGLPDGMVVHSSGVIFATGPGGVWLFDQHGKVLAKIRTGQLTSNCTLNTDESQLYITADDYLMSIKLK